MSENIKAEEFKIGFGSFVHPSAQICGPDGGLAKQIIIGDNTYIGERVQIRCNEFEIGDYGKIHHDTNVHGAQPCKIGHNFWCGQFSILDCTGGLSIGNNVGVGAHSQLWSHIKYGDTLAGCLFNQAKPLIVEDDVWFVGHCVVSPITAKTMSMALAGSVVTKDMLPNQVYAGTPAKLLEDKKQFEPIDYGKRLERMWFYLNDFMINNDTIGPPLRICIWPEEIEDRSKTWFVISERKYLKQGTQREIAFMKYLLPEKAKFVPYE